MSFYEATPLEQSLAGRAEDTLTVENRPFAALAGAYFCPKASIQSAQIHSDKFFLVSTNLFCREMKPLYS